MTDALRQGWKRNWGEQVIPFDSNESVRSGLIAATVKSVAFTGVALVDPVSGAIERRIETFTNPTAEQAGGAYDGQYVVWKDMPIAGDLDEWVVKEWNASTGSIRILGASRRDRHGNPIPSTWQDPVMGGGYAAWVQGLDNNGAGQIVLLDLRRQVTTVVHKGHPGWLALTDSQLIWAESPMPGAQTLIQAIAPQSGRSVKPPLPLVGARGAWGFVTNGKGWMWVAGNTPTVYYGDDAERTVVRVGTVPQGGGSPPLAITDSVGVVPVSAGGAMVINLHGLGWTYVPDIAWAASTGAVLFANQENATGAKSGGVTTGLATLAPAAVAAIRCAN